MARACGRPEIATAPGLYRAELPLAPYAVALETGSAPPDCHALAGRVRAIAASISADTLIVEGAGGLLVPIDAHATMAEFAAALELPVVLVARDELGVLSSVLTSHEAARARGLAVAGVVLSAHAPRPDDPSPRTNRRILQERLDCPVLGLPTCPDDDDALADAAERAALLSLLAPS